MLGRIDDAGTRTIVVEDTEGRADLAVDVVHRIEALVGVQWAVGFGPTRDVRAAGLNGAAPVPVRALFGELPEPTSTSGWQGRPGTAVVGSAALNALGFTAAAGPIQLVGPQGREIGVVGWLHAGAPLEFLNRSVLTVPESGEPVARVIVLADSAQRVPGLAHAIETVIDAADPTSLTIETSGSLLQVRAAVQGELGSWGRNMVALVLAAGLILTALNVLGAVTTRRRDFGRRRALGASRLDIAVLVAGQTLAIATMGAAAGVAIGTAVMAGVVGTAADVEFSIAVTVLAVLAAAIASLPPALIAAFRDPVRILRVP